MLVCHCRAVSDRTIRQAVRNGASDIYAVGEACGAAADCGGCAEAVVQIIERTKAQRVVPAVRPAFGLAPAES